MSKPKEVSSKTMEGYISQRIQEYSTDPEHPLSPIDAFHAAADKAHRHENNELHGSWDRAKRNPYQHQVHIPWVGSGFAYENPRIQFRIHNTDPKTGLEILNEKPLFEMDERAVPIQTDRKMISSEISSDAAERFSNDAAVFVRESEEHTAFHLYPPESSIKHEIPSHGTWTLRVEAQMPSYSAKKQEVTHVTPIECSVHGDYDIGMLLRQHSKASAGAAAPSLISSGMGTANAAGDDHERCFSIRQALHSPVHQEQFENLPESTLVLHIRQRMRDVSSGAGADASRDRFFLEGLSLETDYTPSPASLTKQTSSVLEERRPHGSAVPTIGKNLYPQMDPLLEPEEYENHVEFFGVGHKLVGVNDHDDDDDDDDDDEEEDTVPNDDDISDNSVIEDANNNSVEQQQQREEEEDDSNSSSQKEVRVYNSLEELVNDWAEEEGLGVSNGTTVSENGVVEQRERFADDLNEEDDEEDNASVPLQRIGHPYYVHISQTGRDDDYTSKKQRHKHSVPSSRTRLLLQTGTDGSEGEGVGIGQVSRILTALTLLRLLQRYPGFDWQRHKHDSRYVTGELLHKSCVGDSLRALYKRSCGLEGPTPMQLLTNTSGLGAYLEVRPDEVYDRVEQVMKQNFTGSEEEFAYELGKQNLLYHPGSKCHDSSLGWGVVGCIIRRLASLGASRPCECVSEPIVETARLLGMNRTWAVQRGQADKVHGIWQSVFVGNHGIISTPEDLTVLIQRFRAPVEPIPGMRSILHPHYAVSLESPESECVGWRSCPRIVRKRKSKKLFYRYTTVDSQGCTAYGDSVRLCLSPELGTNIVVSVRGFTQHQGSAIIQRLVDRVHDFVRGGACCGDKIKVLRKYGVRPAPLVPLKHLRLPQMPPFYSRMCSGALVHRRRIHQGAPCASACHERNVCTGYCAQARKPGCSLLEIGGGCAGFSFGINFGWGDGACGSDYQPNKCCRLDEATRVLHELYKRQTVLIPLFGQLAVSDKLVVHRDDPTGRYVIRFFSSETAKHKYPRKQRDLEELELQLVDDRQTDSFRVLYDETPADYVHVFHTRTKNDNPVYGISVNGVPYFNNEYIISNVHKIQSQTHQISSNIEKDIYSEQDTHESQVQHIGARWVLPTLGVLGAAGAGFLAAGALASAARRRRGYYYNNYYLDPYYYGYYDPYGYGYVPYNASYYPPLWGLGGYRRYPYWTYNPYYYWSPRYRRYIYRRPFRYGWRGRRPGRRFWRPPVTGPRRRYFGGGGRRFGGGGRGFGGGGGRRFGGGGGGGRRFGGGRGGGGRRGIRSDINSKQEIFDAQLHAAQELADRQQQ